MIPHFCNLFQDRLSIPQMAQPSRSDSFPSRERLPREMDHLPRRHARRLFPSVAKRPALEITTIPEDSEVDIFPWIKCTCFPPSPPQYQSIFEEDLDSDEEEEMWIEDTSIEGAGGNASSERIGGNAASQHSAGQNTSIEIAGRYYTSRSTSQERTAGGNLSREYLARGHTARDQLVTEHLGGERATVEHIPGGNTAPENRGGRRTAITNTPTARETAGESATGGRADHKNSW